VDRLINYGKGLNLTYAVRDGIINHCGEAFEQQIRPDFRIKELSTITTPDFYPTTWEGAVMRMADKVAYLGRDVEDAIHLKLISDDELPPEATSVLGRTNSEIIDTMVNDIIKTSIESGAISLSDRVFHSFEILKDFNYSHIYQSEKLSDYHEYFGRILRTLIEYLEELFAAHRLDFAAYGREKNSLAVRFGDYLQKMQSFYESDSWGNAVVDYVAGMTDDFAIDSVHEILLPGAFETLF